jgi:hypothetical protein
VASPSQKRTLRNNLKGKKKKDFPSVRSRDGPIHYTSKAPKPPVKKRTNDITNEKNETRDLPNAN